MRRAVQDALTFIFLLHAAMCSVSTINIRATGVGAISSIPHGRITAHFGGALVACPADQRSFIDVVGVDVVGVDVVGVDVVRVDVVGVDVVCVVRTRTIIGPVVVRIVDIVDVIDVVHVVHVIVIGVLGVERFAWFIAARNYEHDQNQNPLHYISPEVGRPLRQ